MQLRGAVLTLVPPLLDAVRDAHPQWRPGGDGGRAIVLARGRAPIVLAELGSLLASIFESHHLVHLSEMACNDFRNREQGG